MATTIVKGSIGAAIAPIRLVAAEPGHAAAVERLLDTAFGEDRRQRTAYRLRDGIAPFAAACCVALAADGTLVGSLQSWPLALRDGAGGDTPLWLVGPIAVAPDHRNLGIARAMIARALAAIDATGLAAVLIGDLDYYGAFGFSAERTGGWDVPGPIDRHRLLYRDAAGQPPGVRGMLAPRPLPPAAWDSRPNDGIGSRCR